MNKYQKIKLLQSWINDLDEKAIDDLIAQYVDDDESITEIPIKDFDDFSYECQYNVLPLEPLTTEYCERNNCECCVGLCPLWEKYKEINQ